MSKTKTEDPRLVRLTKICLALPEAVRDLCRQRAGFTVRKRIFAWFLRDHHGDGIVAVSSKVIACDNTALAGAMPERFYLPAYMGPKGWVALRLGSYRLLAPKRLAALVSHTVL